jgi:L-alanine-DL-glutamate epimerase-like enolase superfamily enzyme
MKITNVEVIQFKYMPKRFSRENMKHLDDIVRLDLFPPRLPLEEQFYEETQERIVNLTKISTDGGVDGYCFGGDMRVVEQKLKDELIGKNPLYREDIWEYFLFPKRLFYGRYGETAAVIDNALWDFAGRLTNLPIYKLLGAYRDKVRIYASSYPAIGPPEVYANHAEECKKRGYTAYKIHNWHNATHTQLRYIDPKEDIAICKAVRERVGDDMVLMLDANAAYSYGEAVWVGRELEKLDFYFLEEPMLEYNTDLYTRLCQELDIAICSPESVLGSFYTRADWVCKHASDISHHLSGSITDLIKTMHMCETFRVKVNTRATTHGLQVLGSAKNYCDYAESGALVHPLIKDEIPPWLNQLKENQGYPLPIDSQGYAHISQKPGLGLSINWDYIEENIVKPKYTSTKDRLRGYDTF